MNYFNKDIVFQEVPGEISLCYFICGCPLRCEGCHSWHTWPEQAGKPLDTEVFEADLQRYHRYISCVLFMGGEWSEPDLLERLRAAKRYGLKTCLYTGLEDVSPCLRSELTYLKTGPWIHTLGGLNMPNTNQRFWLLKTGECLNQAFQNQNIAI